MSRTGRAVLDGRNIAFHLRMSTVHRLVSRVYYVRADPRCRLNRSKQALLCSMYYMFCRPEMALMYLLIKIDSRVLLLCCCSSAGSVYDIYGHSGYLSREFDYGIS